VLKEAQELGYAEVCESFTLNVSVWLIVLLHIQADPTADVEGHDVCAKICILAKLAFGVTVDPALVPCQGITQITSTDFEYAKLMGCTIKLVGTAARQSKYGEYYTTE
jgi:homoserine dehydrogenase